MTQATNTPKDDRDVIARLAGRGEQTIAKLERELATLKRAQKPKASTGTRARKASE